MYEVMILSFAYIVTTLYLIKKNHFGGSYKKHFRLFLSMSFLIPLTSACLLIFSEPYRLERITVFLTRGKSDPSSNGWMTIMLDKILQNSKLVGPMTPLSEFPDFKENPLSYYMPSLSFEYALVNIIANLGYLAGFAVIAVCIFLIIKMIVTSLKIKTNYLKAISLSMCTMLSFQLIMGILLNFGLVPYVGISLPFISQGGTALIINTAQIAIIISIFRRNNLILNKEEAEYDSEKKDEKRKIKNENEKILICENGKIIFNFYNLLRILKLVD